MARKRKQNLNSSEVNLMGEDIFEPIVEPIEPQPIYKVHVTHPSLRRRKAPHLQAEIEGLIEDQGIYEIFEEVNGWGRLKDNTWIMLTYTEQLF